MPKDCSREEYIRAAVGKLLTETPERRKKLLSTLTEKDWPGWRKAFDAEIAIQQAAIDKERAERGAEKWRQVVRDVQARAIADGSAVYVSSPALPEVARSYSEKNDV